MASAAIDTTFGAAYIGVVVAAILYGVTFVQSWYYFVMYRKDVWYIKTLVGAIWAAETVHQALISHTVYHYVITNYNRPMTLDDIVWSILLEVLFNGLIGLLVQGFLALRVWRLSNRNTPLIVVVVCLVIACFACSVAFTVQSMKLQPATWVALGRLKGLSMAVNLLGAVTDLLIAAALCTFLNRSRTGFKNSDNMISKLITFTVSTGMLTCICAVASLISILVKGHTLIYVAFYFSLGRLYSNSVLATLNARQTIRDIGENSDDLSFSLQTMSKSANAGRSTNISIKIDTMQDFLRDPRRPSDDPTEAECEVTD